MSNPMIIAGCGPGAADYVTPAVMSAAEGADVLVGAERLLELFPHLEAERHPLAGDLAGALDAARRHREAGDRVCVLVTGSPGLCSLASTVLERVGRANCRILPGISSVQVACARVGIDWQDVRVINAHDGPPETVPSPGHAGPKTAILLGKPDSARWAAEFIESMSACVRLFACEELTLPDEEVYELTASELREVDFPSRTVLLVIQEGELT